MVSGVGEANDGGKFIPVLSDWLLQHSSPRIVKDNTGFCKGHDGMNFYCRVFTSFYTSVSTLSGHVIVGSLLCSTS